VDAFLTWEKWPPKHGRHHKELVLRGSEMIWCREDAGNVCCFDCIARPGGYMDFWRNREILIHEAAGGAKEEEEDRVITYLVKVAFLELRDKCSGLSLG